MLETSRLTTCRPRHNFPRRSLRQSISQHYNVETQQKDKSLTDHSLNGFSWLAGRTVATRLVRHGGQIVL